MFLTGNSGYDSHGGQKCSGKFLVVFTHNQFKWAEQTGQDWRNIPREFSRQLYGFVCNVTMTQCGNCMMGTAKSLEVQGKKYKHLVLSGTYGGDGLPCDYEDLTEEARKKLVLVPYDLAEEFWHSGGHNCSGVEGPAMRKWAIETFKVGRQ